MSRASPIRQADFPTLCFTIHDPCNPDTHTMILRSRCTAKLRLTEKDEFLFETYVTVKKQTNILVQR